MVGWIIGGMLLSLAAPAASFATIRSKDSGGSTKSKATASKPATAKSKPAVAKGGAGKPAQRKAVAQTATEPKGGRKVAAPRSGKADTVRKSAAKNSVRTINRSKPKGKSVAVVRGRPKATRVAKAGKRHVPAQRRRAAESVDPWSPSELDQSPIYGDAGELPGFRDLDLLDDDKRYELLNHAVSLLGRPYRFGAAGGRAFDCSGFVQSVFGNVGVDLPHSAREQFDHGDVVRRGELVPGDLVFFRTYRRGASHVGIYMGEDKFIHAASRFGVRISSLNSDYYSARYLGARRLDI